MDPVCKKEVEVNKRTLRSSCESEMYYFCSKECKQAFEDDPALYYQTCHD
ncbi:MAG TPA: YHS domain-containing protein [Candidatus Lokiarchaeia archaeon]|nr:YHS domain-containing protein [Candidatus Lokiarchaeia archaeon]